MTVLLLEILIKLKKKKLNLNIFILIPKLFIQNLPAHEYYLYKKN